MEQGQGVLIEQATQWNQRCFDISVFVQGKLDLFCLCQILSMHQWEAQINTE
jgi:hypothetical protein